MDKLFRGALSYLLTSPLKEHSFFLCFKERDQLFGATPGNFSVIRKQPYVVLFRYLLALCVESTLIIFYWFLDTSYLYLKWSFVVPLNNSNKNLSCILSYLITMAQFSSSHPFISKLPVQVVAVQLFFLYMATKPVVCYQSGFSLGHFTGIALAEVRNDWFLADHFYHPSGAFSVPGWSHCPFESLEVCSLQLSWCQCSNTLLF